MRATTAVPSTVLAATVTATMAEAVRKHLASTSWFAIKREALECGTQSESCNYGSVIFVYHVLPVSHWVQWKYQTRAAIVYLHKPAYVSD